MTMTDEALSTHPNIKVIDGIAQYHSGTGKVLRHGDRFRVAGKGEFRVTTIFVDRDYSGGPLDPIEQVYITGYGGKRDQMLTRTFHVDRCERIVKQGEDPKQPLREALKEASDASKRGKRGYK